MRINLRLFLNLNALLFISNVLLAQQSGNYVVMNVQPINAQVYIDSIEYKLADGKCHSYLPTGQHAYTISSNGFSTESGTFQISPSFRTELNIKLKSNNAFVTIFSELDGVILSMDGINVSSGWCDYVSPGVHTLRASKSGYKTYEKNFTVSAGQEINITVPTLIHASGGINVDVMPYDVEVFVDNVNRGMSPLIINDIDVGKHNIMLKKEGYVTLRKRVSVKENQMTNIKGKLISYEPVDLGLDVTWATFNCGVSSPYMNGTSVSWGALSSTSGSPGYVYNNFGILCIQRSEQLSNSEDLATTEWGDGWHMPSYENCVQLISRCKWRTITEGGQKYALVTGPSGLSIILPFGAYWTKNRNAKWGSSDRAYSLNIYEDLNNPSKAYVTCGQYCGHIFTDDSEYYCTNGYTDDGMNMEHKSMIRPVKFKK